MIRKWALLEQQIKAKSYEKEFYDFSRSKILSAVLYLFLSFFGF